MKRGRPPRSAALVRAVVEYMESPHATKAAAAEKFNTVERNIENILTDPRAKSWADTPLRARQLIVALERSNADGIRKFQALSGSRWHNPKLELIEKVLTPEELDRRSDESIDDVYELAVGRQTLNRRRKRPKTQSTQSQRK